MNSTELEKIYTITVQDKLIELGESLLRRKV